MKSVERFVYVGRKNIKAKQVPPMKKKQSILLKQHTTQTKTRLEKNIPKYSITLTDC